MATILGTDLKDLIAGGAAIGGVLVGWFGRGIGFWLTRRITRAPQKERVDYLTSVAGLMSKMRTDGVSVAEVAAFEIALRSPALSGSRGITEIVEQEDSEEIDPYTTTYAMRSRAYAQYNVVDARLSQVLVDQRLVLSRLEESAVADMHSRWIEYRTALMEAAASEYEGGSLASILSAYVGIAETERRTSELQLWVDARVARIRREEKAIPSFDSFVEADRETP